MVKESQTEIPSTTESIVEEETTTMDARPGKLLVRPVNDGLLGGFDETVCQRPVPVLRDAITRFLPASPLTDLPASAGLPPMPTVPAGPNFVPTKKQKRICLHFTRRFFQQLLFAQLMLIFKYNFTEGSRLLDL